MLSLSVDRKEVTLSTKQVDPNLLTIRSVQAVNVQYSEPKSLTIAKQESQLDLTLLVTRSGILREKSSEHADIDYYCQFYQSSVLMAESLVLEVADSQHSLVRVTCEMPVIDDQYQQGQVNIGIVIKRTPAINGLPQINVNVTQNLHSVIMMRVPTITNIFPPKIYNLALIN